MDEDDVTPEAGGSGAEATRMTKLNTQAEITPEHDLVGGQFAVLESDPGVFTTLVRRLGVRGVEVIELYDIEPWAVEGLQPLGLVFCFLWAKDHHRATDFADPAAEHVWFANQLADDACASLAILNVLFNCPGCEVGSKMAEFRAETADMSAVMKGLAITNSCFIRETHNSLARPADIRGALNAIAASTIEELKASKAPPKQPPPKRRKTGPKARPRASAAQPENEETFHFIGYVPAHGKVWELDGLKTGPLEVGELPGPSDSTEKWMDIVRPALRMKMERYSDDGDNIRFSLLAVVDDRFLAARDQLELRKRERLALERRLDTELPGGWAHLVDGELLADVDAAFTTSTHGPAKVAVETKGFGEKAQGMSLASFALPAEQLVSAWEQCVRTAKREKNAVEEELSKARVAQTEQDRRTHDYEPFLREYIACLQQEGLLDALLERDTSRVAPTSDSAAGAKSRRKR